MLAGLLLADHSHIPTGDDWATNSAAIKAIQTLLGILRYLLAGGK